MTCGAWASTASASYYDGIVAVVGPGGSAIATGSGTCSSGITTINSGQTVLTPASGDGAQWVAARTWFHDLNTGEWSNRGWSAWARSSAAAPAIFSGVQFHTELDYRPHHYEVVIEGAWYFSNGTTRSQFVKTSYFLQQNWTTSSYGTTCYA